MSASHIRGRGSQNRDHVVISVTSVPTHPSRFVFGTTSTYARSRVDVPGTERPAVAVARGAWGKHTYVHHGTYATWFAIA